MTYEHWNGMETGVGPEDVPEPTDFDAAARRADLDNDSGIKRRYLHIPMSREQIEAAIARMPVPQLTKRQA